MVRKLYVGNLSHSVQDEELLREFEKFGSVTSAKVMMDRQTGRSKGFGFVEMDSDAAVLAAISAMGGDPVTGRVSLASLPERGSREARRRKHELPEGELSHDEEPRYQEAMKLITEEVSSMQSNMDRSLVLLNQSIEKISGRHA
jgi:RNA recognition motif-containing protein